MHYLAWPLLAALAGSLVYCALVLVAARRYLDVRPPELAIPEPVSILKPLHGLDEGLEANLRSFFEQDYPAFEILFALRSPTDPAIPIVEKLQREFPGVAARLLVTGEPPYANAKVFCLEKMLEVASHDLLVMSDSDIRVTPTMLRAVAAEFQDQRIGVATCPYRAVAGASVWSRLEALGMNTEFFAGVLVARMLEGMKFAVGPTIVARKSVLDAVGGCERLKDYLAEDFVLGKFAAELGFGVILSSYVVEHRIGSEPWSLNATHRVRWARSTRRSRPAGYVGGLFTNPIPIALLLCVAQPSWWPVFFGALALRSAAAYVVSVDVLSERVLWHLLFVQDLLSFAFWVAGFFGNTIIWRGRRYHLMRDGRFRLIEDGAVEKP